MKKNSSLSRLTATATLAAAFLCRAVHAEPVPPAVAQKDSAVADTEATGDAADQTPVGTVGAPGVERPALATGAAAGAAIGCAVGLVGLAALALNATAVSQALPSELWLAASSVAVLMPAAGAAAGSAMGATAVGAGAQDVSGAAGAAALGASAGFLTGLGASVPFAGVWLLFGGAGALARFAGSPEPVADFLGSAGFVGAIAAVPLGTLVGAAVGGAVAGGVLEEKMVAGLARAVE